MADSKVSALSEVSVPDFSDDVYLVDNTGPTSYKCGTDRFFGLGSFVPGGRLTLTSGTAVTTSDVTAAGTLYYTPYLHDRIRIYDGTRWLLYAFTERSLSLTLTSGKNYDVFIYDNSGTLTLELSSAWTNDTTRADALTTQDGVQVKSGATSRLWLGTIRSSGTNTTEDSAGGTTTQVGGKRFVWNAYNRVARHILVTDTADSWTYATSSYRVINGATAPSNCVEFVLGGAELVRCTHGIHAGITANNNGFWGGLGLDSGTASSAQINCESYFPGATVAIAQTCHYSGYPSIGYHYLSALEKVVGGTITFYGDNGGTNQTGLIAEVWA